MKKLIATVLASVMVTGLISGCSMSAGSGSTTAAKAVTTAAATKAASAAATTKAAAASSGTTAKAGAAATTAKAGEKKWFGTADKKPVTLRLWAGVQPEYGYDEVIKNFNKEYADQGVQAEYVRYVNDTDGNVKLETQLMQPGDIDVFISYGGASTYKNRVKNNLMKDMTDYLKTYKFDPDKELGKTSVEPFYYGDKKQIYGVPTKYENGRWMLVNENMFKDAGVAIPYDGWTYDQFTKACEALTKGEGQNKVYGMNWCTNMLATLSTEAISSVLGDQKTYTSKDATATNFDNEIWAKGVELMKTTMDKGWAYTAADEKADSLTVANTFLEGKCAMSLNISQMRLCMDKATYPHDFTTALVPFPVPSDKYMTPEFKTHAKTTGAGDVICIAQNTKNADAAAEFVMWYIRGGMAPLAKGGRIPLWSGFDSSKVVSVLQENAAGALDMDSLKKYMSIDKSLATNTISTAKDKEIGSVLAEEISAALYGKKPVADALKSAKQRSDEILAKK